MGTSRSRHDDKKNNSTKNNYFKEKEKSIGILTIEDAKGTGFFIDLSKNDKKLNFIITNQHLINKENIEIKKKISFAYNNNKNILEFELDKDKRIIYSSKGLGYDVTVIQILPDDKIPEEYFLKPDLTYMDICNKLLDKEIFIIKFTEENELKYPEGEIKSISNNDFSHTASTLKNSGFPIILKNKKEVIGIHRNGNKDENYGDLLYPIIKELEEKTKPKIPLANGQNQNQNQININSPIKEKIVKLVNKCKVDEIYSNIMSDYFTQGIVRTSFFLESLQILPFLKENELKKNFEKNIQRIIYCINNEIKPGLTIYNVLSCIYGAFYGDVLGSFCEHCDFDKSNHNKIFKVIPAFGGEIGQITDDSEMAMSFAYAIMDNPSKETIDVNYLYFYYGAWFKSNPLDIGFTTRKAFEKFDFKQYHPKKLGFKNVEQYIYSSNYNSLSNGFLMRKSTFIAWLFYRFYGEINKAFNEIQDIEPLLNLYKKIKDLSHIDNQCTHPNEEVDIASSFYCIMALGALCKLRPNNILYKLENLCQNEYFNTNGKNFKDFFLNSLNIFKSQNFDFYNFFGNKQSPDRVLNHMGWYGHAFKLVIYYLVNAEKYEEKTGFETIMNEICDLGGDTDTNCCIVGGIMGPIFGMKNFGNNFNKALELIPPNRDIYSIALMIPYIVYLNKSNKNEELIKNERYFLKTILTLLYDEFNLDLS